VVGEIGFLDGHPRTHHVRAGTACRVRRLTRDGLIALGQAEPRLFAKVSLALAGLMARRFRGALEELDPLRAFASSLGEADETLVKPVRAAEPSGESEHVEGHDDSPIQYDEIEDPLLDQALDVLRDLARRPSKDLAGV
jgi:hypothetical protein